MRRKWFLFIFALFELSLAFALPIFFYLANLIDNYNIIFFFVLSMALIFSGGVIIKYLADGGFDL